MATIANIVLRCSLAAVTLLGILFSVQSAEAVSPRRLVEIVDIGQPAVSPDGSNVAYRVEKASIERNTYDTIWYVQRIDGTAPPIRVADGGGVLRDSAGLPLPVAATWSPDGKWIYYRALLDSQISVWRAAVDGTEAEPVTHDSADVRDFSLSPDGKYLRYSVGATREAVVTAEQAEYDRGIRIDGTVPIGQGLFRSGKIEGRLATQRFSEVWFDRTSLLSDVPARWKAVELRARASRDLAPAQVPRGPMLPSDLSEAIAVPWVLSQDASSGRIALLTRTGDANGLLEMPIVELAMLSHTTSRHPIKCKADLCVEKAISGVQWLPESDEVLFTVTDEGAGLAQSIFRWNVRTDVVRPVVRSQGLINGGRDLSSGCGLSPAALVCVVADADVPPRLERIDLESGERRILFEPNAALAHDMTRAAAPQLLRWTDERGQRFTGWFFAARQEADVPAPLFVSYYRCPGFVRGGYGDEWPLASFAEHGISALCINRAPTRIDAVERYEQGRSAVESVVELLAAAGKIDRDRIGMGGLSFGAEVTLWTVIHSDLIAAASLSSPLVSQQYYLLGSLKGEVFSSGLEDYWQLGAPGETVERWSLLSPAENLDRIQAPVLMQFPEQEYLHTLDYAIPLVQRQQADVYVFPHEPHQKFQPRHKLAVYKRNLDWFRFWLQDIEDANPARSEQYAHWRRMRAAISDRLSRSDGRKGRD